MAKNKKAVFDVDMAKFTNMAVIEIRLLIIRGWRIIKILCPKKDILLYSFIVILWMIYGFLSNKVAMIHDGEIKTYTRTLWELRNSVFSSVVLAFAVSSFNHLNEYRKVLKRQHFLYVDSMEDFEEVFYTIIPDKMWKYFHALYNDKCMEISMKYIQNRLSKEILEEKDFVIWKEMLEARLEKIELQLKNEMLFVKNEEMLALDISSSRKLIKELYIGGDIEKFNELIYALYHILEELRFVWRRDIELDTKLNKLDTDVKNNFYKRMWSPDFSIDNLKAWCEI